MLLFSTILRINEKLTPEDYDNLFDMLMQLGIMDTDI